MEGKQCLHKVCQSDTNSVSMKTTYSPGTTSFLTADESTLLDLTKMLSYKTGRTGDNVLTLPSSINDDDAGGEQCIA